MAADGRGNHATLVNQARTRELKALVADCEDIDARCRRILGAFRGSWWGKPYHEDEQDRSREAA